MTYPSGVRKLEILYLARIGIMMFGRVITLYTPVQTERILRTFSQNNLDTNGTPVLSTFDMASIVSYVLYDYLQRYSNVLQALDQIINSPVDGHVQNSMTLRFFEHVHTLSMGYHYDTNSAKTISAMRVGVRSTANVSETLLFKILPNMLDVILSVAYFWFAWGWKYGLLITINGCLYAVVIYFVERYKANAWKGHHNSTYDADMRAVDSLQNFETVKYFTNEGFELDRYRQGLVGHIEEALKERAKHYLLLAPRDLLWSWNLFAGCMLCAYEIAQENRDPSSFMTFVLHSKQLEGPVDSFGWMFRMLRHEFTHMDNLLDILELEPTVKDIPNAPPLASPSTTSKASGEIEFEDVSFQYGSDKKGLSNISFKIPQGSTVGIVGPTGSGKSTLLRLAFRLWDPTSGRILIDGQDISKVTQRSVREQIGVVPQDTALLNESILYNIGYARPSATKAEIEEAAKAAQIHDSIMSFEHDYNTSVGERGAKLSGGERQRIGIARVVLKNPPIILLDEATSALDSTTESEIQKALNAMTQNRTTLVVAHRLSTIMHADLILFVKDGRIVEQGTHEELVQRAVDKGGKGEYYKMWRIQSGECSSFSSSASTVGEDETHITSLAITPADPADPSDLAKSVPEGPTSTSEKKTEE
ncbi:ATP-binding cassette sub- B member 6, mitochondrial [Mortierella sp. AD031]|nr:ATP-binding cassette sub- B member 6, mitochondrial [Mortierella sp. AD031]